MSTLFAFLLFLQTTNATISGTVTDPAGATAPNVQIQAANTKTGIVFKTVSNDAGVYQFPSVQPGTYKLTAELIGFRTIVFNDVTVDIAAQLSIPFALTIASLTDSVEVTATESPLLVSTPSVGGVITGKRMQELPLP